MMKPTVFKALVSAPVRNAKTILLQAIKILCMQHILIVLIRFLWRYIPNRA